MSVHIEWVGHACFRVWRDGGPVIVNNKLFVTSGNDYAQFAMPGNVLLMFELDE